MDDTERESPTEAAQAGTGAAQAVFRFTGYSPLYLVLVIHATAPVSAVFTAILLRRRHPGVRLIAMTVVLGLSAAPLFLVLPIAARFVPSHHLALATFAAMVIWATLLFSTSTFGDWLFRDTEGRVWPPIEDDHVRLPVSVRSCTPVPVDVT